MHHQTGHLNQSTRLLSVYKIEMLYSNMLPIKLLVYLFVVYLTMLSVAQTTVPPVCFVKHTEKFVYILEKFRL
jgi:hypothetical protein